MSFFPPDSPPPEHVSPQRQPWWGPPYDEIPTLIAASALLASTNNVACALLGARVYSTGVELLIEKKLRRADWSRQEWDDAAAKFNGMHLPGYDLRQRLRYGLALSDGQRVTETIIQWDSTETPPGHVLVSTGGGGGGDDQVLTFTDGLWLWPLPPPGPLSLVIQWPAFQITDTRTPLDTDQILAGATLVRPLWT